MIKSASVALGGHLIKVADALALTRRMFRAFPRLLTRRMARLIPLPARYAVLERELSAATLPYLPALREKRRTLLVADAFGRVRHEDWSRELGDFLVEVVMPRLGARSELAWRRLPHVAGRLDALIAGLDRTRHH